MYVCVCVCVCVYIYIYMYIYIVYKRNSFKNVIEILTFMILFLTQAQRIPLNTYIFFSTLIEREHLVLPKALIIIFRYLLQNCIDTKPSDYQVPVLELWGMWSSPSLSLLPSPL